MPYMFLNAINLFLSSPKNRILMPPANPFPPPVPPPPPNNKNQNKNKTKTNKQNKKQSSFLRYCKIVYFQEVYNGNISHKTV